MARYHHALSGNPGVEHHQEHRCVLTRKVEWLDDEKIYVGFLLLSQSYMDDSLQLKLEKLYLLIQERSEIKFVRALN